MNKVPQDVKVLRDFCVFVGKPAGLLEKNLSEPLKIGREMSVMGRCFFGWLYAPAPCFRLTGGVRSSPVRSGRAMPALYGARLSAARGTVS